MEAATKNNQLIDLKKAPPSVWSGGQFPFAGASPGDYYAIVFFLLLSSMSLRQDTVMTESKQIAANAKIQNILNDQNAKVTFSLLPTNAKTATINRVQAQNQQYAALREDIQNCLITARQNAQVMMTQASTNVHLLQIDASEDSGWMDTLNTIFKVINDMNQ